MIQTSSLNMHKQDDDDTSTIPDRIYQSSDQNQEYYKQVLRSQENEVCVPAAITNDDGEYTEEER
jgi:hypothetical protein